MKKYFIPVSSEDFNNVFSTESISPKEFYQKRNFGYKRFNSQRFDIPDDLIILFPYIGEYSIDTQDTSTFPFYIEVDRSLLHEKFIVYPKEKNSELIGYCSTIYFIIDKVKFIFRSKEELKHVRTTSLRSSETKFIEKFENYFLEIAESRHVFVGKKPKTLSFTATSHMIEEQVIIDRKSNAIKGLLYGYFIGWMETTTKDFSQLLKKYRNIHNSIGAFINAADILISNKKSKSDKKDKTILNSQFQKIQKEISEFSTISTSNFKEESISSQTYNWIIAQNIKSDAETLINDLKKLNLSNSQNVYEYITDGIILQCNTIETICICLSKEILNYRTKIDGSYIKRKEIDLIRENIYGFLEALKIRLDWIKKNESTEIPEFINIKIDDSLMISNIKETQIRNDVFELILNILVRNAKSNYGSINPSVKVDLISKIGIKLKDSNIYKDFPNSPERDYLNNLAHYIRNSTREFDLFALQDKVILGFAAFIIKMDDLSKLIDFLQINLYEEKYIPITFWSTFNGISNISKTYTDPLFKYYDKPGIPSIDRLANDLVLRIPNMKIDDNFIDIRKDINYNKNIDFNDQDKKLSVGTKGDSINFHWKTNSKIKSVNLDNTEIQNELSTILKDLKSSEFADYYSWTFENLHNFIYDQISNKKLKKEITLFDKLSLIDDLQKNLISYLNNSQVKKPLGESIKLDKIVYLINFEELKSLLMRIN